MLGSWIGPTNIVIFLGKRIVPCCIPIKELGIGLVKSGKMFIFNRSFNRRKRIVDSFTNCHELHSGYKPHIIFNRQRVLEECSAFLNTFIIFKNGRPPSSIRKSIALTMQRYNRPLINNIKSAYWCSKRYRQNQVREAITRSRSSAALALLAFIRLSNLGQALCIAEEECQGMWMSSGMWPT